LVVAALCLAFFLQGYFSSLVKSPTSDEPIHILAGATYVATRDIVANPQHPPLLKELSGLSLALAGIHWRNLTNIPLRNLPARWEGPAGSKFLSAMGVVRTVFWARLPLLLLSPLTGLLIYLWGRELAGTAAGLCAVFLFAADPTMVAHSYLVTTDSGVTAFSLLFLLLLFRYFQNPSAGRSALAGIALGLALCAKFSAIFLLPIAGILVAAWCRPQAVETGKKKRRKSPVKWTLPTRSAVKEMAVLAIAAILVVQICYFSLKGPFLYLYGLGQVNADHRPDFEAFLDNRMQHRFAGYFAATWMLKEPLATIGLALAGVYLVFRARAIPRLSKFFLFVPPCVFFLACTIWADDIGIRYLMPAMPFGFIAGGLALATLLKGHTAAKIVAAMACVWITIAAAGIYPDHLSYFNEGACLPEHSGRIGLDGGSRCGSDWLADSNVDWGQSLPQLKEWLDRNLPGQTGWLKYFGSYPPEEYGIKFQSIEPEHPSGPPPGIYVVSSHHVAYWGSYNKFSWMRGEPVAVVGHAYSVFRF
jgi:hypothetical protein